MNVFEHFKIFTGQLNALDENITARPDHMRTIAKGEIDGPWPFTVNIITVAIVEGDYAIVKVGTSVFALNGLAATKFKLKHIQDTEYYKTVEVEGTEDATGKKQRVGEFSLQPFINLTLFLDRRNEPGKRTVFNLKL